jgi:L-ectoine synthase
MEEVRHDGNALTLGKGDVRVVRMLNAEDGLGFSLSRTSLGAGCVLELWYKYHWEANLVLHGVLEVTDHASGESYRLGEGDVYCVGPADKHRLVAKSDVELVCIFNPPLNGHEVHDEDGAYPPSGPIPPGPEGVRS